MAHKIKFTKMHGCGNDYIYVDTMQYPIADPVQAAILWSDRHKGIGSDGLVLIGASPIPEADYTMRIFNADGSEAMMCGNASRCIGKYLYERSLTPNPSPKGEGSNHHETQIKLLTKSGIKTLFLHIKDEIVESVTVDMGEPVLEDEKLFNPQIAKSLSTPLAPWRGDGGEAALFVSMGNPHYVIFTDDVDQVGETGRILEHHPAFPQRCNIEFASPLPLEGPGGLSVFASGSVAAASPRPVVQVLAPQLLLPSSRGVLVASRRLSWTAVRSSSNCARVIARPKDAFPQKRITSS